MRTTTRAALATALAPAALGAALLGAGPAAAAETYSITLSPQNDSGASGTALLTAGDDGSLRVRIDAEGLVPGAPHAQHVHGGADMSRDFMCPTPEADADGDGIVSTAEGLPDYGDIFISLTTEGDTSKDSGLAVDRFPVADAEGRVSYDRTIPAAELPEGTLEAIRNLHVVQHGIDVNGNGQYDAEAGPSELDPALPQEATAPADCGMVEGATISHVPEGGVETGHGAVAHDGGASSAPLVAGGAALAAAGVLFGLSRRGARRGERA
ncbi:hypothetical protein [Vallicoccus soli]|uniref:CHRD domain-containing protein n=1 Tax=Vallicoccus soli TaxID=2339232 RepID=A0A3A3Z2L8_9ACTN|nr:hypothetical protein [Vallicoccus soli]RJK96974.1 hypothetical protein D5H78_06970 [Vallicoccus soli]